MKDVLSGTVATRLHFLLALGLSYSIGVVETLSLASSALRLLLVLFRLSQRNRAEASKPCRQWSRCSPCAIVRNLFQSPGLHAHATASGPLMYHQPPLPVWYHTIRHRIAVGRVDDIDLARIFRAWHWHRFDPSGGSRVARLGVEATS